MNRIKRYSINLNDETCACLRELSTYLGVKEEDIIKLFVEKIAFYFPKSYVEEKVDDIVRSFQNTKYDALEFEIRKVLNFGKNIKRDFETFLSKIIAVVCGPLEVFIMVA